MSGQSEKITITGANGFVGYALCAEAIVRGLSVRGVTRSQCILPKGVDRIFVAGIDGCTDWCDALHGSNVVVHLAARVHVMLETAANPLMEFRRINVEGTLNLARQAARAGVRRFIFISSIKVNGEETAVGRPFTAEDLPRPQDAYGVSKMEAEQALRSLAAQTGMEVVIIRPPLVYGPGVRANFEALLRAVARGIPLPLGALQNRRSLVALDNLIDLIACCVDHAAAAGQTFMVSDGEDMSTSDLIKRTAKAVNCPARLVPVPVGLLHWLGKLTGKSSAIQRLCGNLQVDISKTKKMLDWEPPVGVDEGLRRAVVQWRK